MQTQNLARSWMIRIKNDVRDFCRAHPDCPAARSNPEIVIDGGRYVALLGESPRTGIFGFGTSVPSALRSFNELYRRTQSWNLTNAATLIPKDLTGV